MPDESKKQKKPKLTLKQQYISTRKGTQLALMQVRQGRGTLKKLIETNDEKNIRLMLMDVLHDAKLDGCDTETLMEIAFHILSEFTMIQNILSLRESAATTVIEGKKKKTPKG